MFFEALAAALVGLLALWFVLDPVLRPAPPAPPVYEPPDPQETPKGLALAALREIEFDRATGKLSEADYDELRRAYTAEALTAIRAEESGATGTDDVERMVAMRVAAIRGGEVGDGVVCPTCGPRPEAEAAFCSSCGRSLNGVGACTGCGAPLTPGARFCGTCGTKVAA
ncbi:MAG: zinc ribbon domain-containing protein [Gemmatimonadales bacterium]|nr:zinc ribbon domain-containing protein [Gemmatimonadales bacterium]